MDIVKLALTLISIVIIVGPIGAALIIYRDNLLLLVLPKNLPDFTQTGAPKIESSGSPTYNPSAHTVLVQYKITNPYDFDIILGYASADVMCANHTGVILGHAAVQDTPVTIPANSYTTIKILVDYTQGEEHINKLHAGQSYIYVNLSNLTVNVQGITVTYQTPPVPAIKIPLT